MSSRSAEATPLSQHLSSLSSAHRTLSWPQQASLRSLVRGLYCLVTCVVAAVTLGVWLWSLHSPPKDRLASLGLGAASVFSLGVCVLLVAVCEAAILTAGLLPPLPETASIDEQEDEEEEYRIAIARHQIEAAGLI